MKIKHKKTAAELLVKSGYATYWKSTKTLEGEVVAYWVCWCEPPENDQPDDTCDLVSSMKGTSYEQAQAIALENYLAWNEKDLWVESERETMRPISAGQYCLHGRRLDRIEFCIKALTKES